MGGTAAFVDAEHALDRNCAEKLGVQMDDLIVSQPDTGEQALWLVWFVRARLLVVDSVAALTPKAESRVVWRLTRGSAGTVIKAGHAQIDRCD